MYHFTTKTESFDVAQKFKDNPDITVRELRMELMNHFKSKSVHLQLSEPVCTGNNKFSVSGNKLFRVGSHSKFSLEKEKKNELEAFLQSEDVQVIHSQIDDKEKVIHITYTSRSLINNYLESACEMIKQDLKTLRDKRQAAIEEQDKVDDQYINSEGMANIQQMLQKRSA